MELLDAGHGAADVRLFTTDLLALSLICRAASNRGFKDLGITWDEQNRRAMLCELWAGLFLAAAYGATAAEESRRRRDLYTLEHLLTEVDEQDWRLPRERPETADTPGVA